MRPSRTFLALSLAAAAVAPALAADVALVVGEPVPDTAVYTVPKTVISRLSPAPAGHRYAVIGNDVVLVANSNHVITRVYEDFVPAQVETRLVVGRAVPAGATFVVPERVLTRLTPAPTGFRYALIGDDVVLVSNRTHRISRIYYDIG